MNPSRRRSARLVGGDRERLGDRNLPIQRHEPTDLAGSSAETGAGQEMTSYLVGQEHALISEPCSCRYSRQRPVVPPVDRYCDMYPTS